MTKKNRTPLNYERSLIIATFIKIYLRQQ